MQMAQLFRLEIPTWKNQLLGGHFPTKNRDINEDTSVIRILITRSSSEEEVTFLRTFFPF